VELGEGLSDWADGESGIDATKPSLGCVGVVVRMQTVPAKSFAATIPLMDP
jgi:hypothetical protein